MKFFLVSFGLKIITFKFVTPMQKRLIIDTKLLSIIVNRLCQQLIETHNDFSNTVIIGLQPKGVYLADRIKNRLLSLGYDIELGYLDITFYRDDFRRRSSTIKANATRIDFLIEGKKVILIDDVLFTGRSVRSALDAINAFGRPENVELLVLIDRKYTRDLPIQADYVGKRVNSMINQKVLVEWKGIDSCKKDNVWLINMNEE